MTYSVEHSANLLVAPLMQNHSEPGVGSRLFNFAYFRGRCPLAVFQLDATTQTIDRAIRRYALHLYLVNFLNAIARRGNVIREVAVVGQQQQTLRVEIQASHRMQAAER